MDSRIYFHQYRRPRYSNPTYLSSNVQNSITFFHEAQNQSYKPHTQVVPRYNIEPEYHQRPSNNPVSSYRPPQDRISKTQLPEISPHLQNNSKLSNYGERSLNLDQKGVYQKQTSPYNIISLKPKEFNDQIKQYPWYSIQNRDDVYYRRMQQAYNQKEHYDNRSKTYEKPVPKEVAGKHTYDIGYKINANPERRPNQQRFTAKMLNHMDELQHRLA